MKMEENTDWYMAQKMLKEKLDITSTIWMKGKSQKIIGQI